jgi:glycosyltransferase involved in cell wall biosynthesis
MAFIEYLEGSAMTDIVSISVVIPTCNREESLLRTLRSLSRSDYPFKEVIVVDSSDSDSVRRIIPEFGLNIRYIHSEKSVCIQRNIGIREAISEWIFLCDDDIEVPHDYIQLLVTHVKKHSEAGAVTGLVLQREGTQWEEQYPISSSLALWWKSIFNLGIWGEIKSNGELAERYRAKGNHVSRAGWPVVTDFSGDYFKTPVYGLGASLVKKLWLLQSPYDEILDRSGIGDNYGVAMGFSVDVIHVVKSAHVYHHRSEQNRMADSVSYYRRLLALHYFIVFGRCQKHVTKSAYYWSLIGNFLGELKSGSLQKALATIKALVLVTVGRNPYVVGRRLDKKVIQPTPW